MNEIIKPHVQSDTKHKIFLSAAELFARDGYYKISVREICEAAHVTKPVLYYYFKDKENLLEELVNETYFHMEKLREKHFYGILKLEDALRNFVKYYIEFLTEFPHLTRFSTFIQPTNVPQRIHDMKKQRYDFEINTFIDVLKKSQSEGIISTDYEPGILALNFIGTFIMLIGEYLLFQVNIEQLQSRMNHFVEFWIKIFLTTDKAET